MLNRIRKLIMLGGVSAIVITSNTLTFAEGDSQVDSKVQASESKEVQPLERAPEETHVSETKPLETQPSETQAPETQPPETQAPETQPPETQAPETQPPETQTPETELPETEPSETQIPETEPPETQISETQPLETEVSEAASEKTQETQLGKEDNKQTISESERIKNSPYSTNEELISHQNIVSVKPVIQDFRFQQVNAPKTIIKPDSFVYEEKTDLSRIVGKTESKTVAYILADADSEWVYVESGECRGFVKSGDLITGELAEFVLSRDHITQMVDVQIPLMNNHAVTYVKTSAYPVIADKVFAIAKSNISVYDNESVNAANIIGTLSKDGLAYILKDCGEVYFIESGNVRGFVAKGSIITGDSANVKVSQKSESSFTVAKENIPVANNPACYYTLLSVQEVDDNSAIRASIVNFALQFVGNPYVWGGTSLTNGADCSGFVQSIYANYGYSIPRVACDQAEYGTQIRIDDAEPGDLIFYAENGYVYHVSMYIGNGQVVQAYSSEAGIIISDIGANAVWATKVI